MTQSRKYIPIREFRELGYLQELNRQFLHPLGLALEVVRNKDGTDSLGKIWDSREDPDGFVYAGIDLKPKAEIVQREWDQAVVARIDRLGYFIQPITEERD